MLSVIFKLALAPLLSVYVLVVVVALDMDKGYSQYLLFVPIAYLLGAVPWGFLITHAIKGVDIREYGSGSIGTSNVLRTGGGALAAVVLALDLSKGLLAVFLARVVADTNIAEVVAGVTALVGHNWSVFLGFRGGRGIVTGLGGLLVMSPVVAGLAMAVFAPVALVSRYLSLGSITSVVAAFVATLSLVLVDQTEATYLLYTGIGGAMIIWQHRGNIRRLVKGTERRLGKPAERIIEGRSSEAGQVS
jgi:glycerol-3-phosphate acyltransferase PlsY